MIGLTLDKHEIMLYNAKTKSALLSARFPEASLNSFLRPASGQRTPIRLPQEEQMILSFLGRNTESILSDARREFGNQPAMVVTRDGDQLQPPAGVETVSVSQFQPAMGMEYTLIANGGTAAQLLPVVKKLVDVAADFAAYDLQREGTVEVWPRRGKEGA
jgi:hypothetical protein